MKKIIITLLVTVAASACGTKAAKNDATQAAAPVAEKVPVVETIITRVQDVPQESLYSSTVQPFATNNIVSQTSGRIRSIKAEVGDYVIKGQVLAEMDRLQLDQTRLQMINDSTELSRIRELHAQGGVAQSDLEALELAYNVRKSTYKNLLENTILRSPLTGFISARNYDAGDMYAMSMPIFTVQQVYPVKLLVGVSESEYTRIKKGDAVTLTVDALPGKTFTGRINRLYPTIDPVTHTFNAEVIVTNADKVLRPGMYARVKVTFGVNKSIVVPDQAIVKQEGTGQRFIYVLNEDGTVSYVPVTLGRHMGTEYEVTAGLKPGQTIVSKGQANLKDGIKVEVR